jgi:hypothetical protein
MIVEKDFSHCVELIDVSAPATQTGAVGSPPSRAIVGKVGRPGAWNQADSVHSQPDGSQNMPNTLHDTSVDRILMSDHFIYFGSKAPKVPQELLTALKYRNGRGYRVFPREQCRDLLKWIEVQTGGEFNRVVDDPFQLRVGDKRYSRTANKII